MNWEKQMFFTPKYLLVKKKILLFKLEIYRRDKARNSSIWGLINNKSKYNWKTRRIEFLNKVNHFIKIFSLLYKKHTLISYTLSK